jgi:hypothetical protein
MTKQKSRTKKAIIISVLAGALAFAGLKGIQNYNYKQTPKYQRISQLDKEAVEVFNSLDKEGYLHYEIDGERLDLYLIDYTVGPHHLHYGNRLSIRVNDNMTLKSEMCKSRDQRLDFWNAAPIGHARKLEILEIKTADGKRVYEVKEISNRENLQNYYETLIKKVYQEKIKIDRQVDSSIDKLLQ